MFCTLMITCAERAKVRAATLASLAHSDWGAEPQLVIDDGAGDNKLDRIRRTWERALDLGAACPQPAVLLLEDDLRIAPTIRRDLENWLPFVKRGRFFFGSLYDITVPLTQVRRGPGFSIGMSEHHYGGQALVTTPATLQAIGRVWNNPKFSGNPYPDGRLADIVSLITPIIYHQPSLVHHVGVSTWNPLRLLLPSPEGA